MAIEIDTETIVPLFDLGKHCPGPRKPSRATVFRWVLDGLRIDGSNQRVKLASVKLNGIRCSSVEELRRFLRVANGQTAVRTITPQQRRRQAEAANELCAARGY